MQKENIGIINNVNGYILDIMCIYIKKAETQRKFFYNC